MRGDELFDELEKAVQIDKYNLDEEAARFPEVFYTVCRELSAAEARLNRFRVERQEVEAQVQDEARDNLEGRGRVTNAMINGYVRKDVTYKKADRLYQKSKERVAKWQALKESLQAKSYKLRDLVDLHIAQYYSDPSPEGDGSTRRRRRLIRDASRGR